MYDSPTSPRNALDVSAMWYFLISAKRVVLPTNKSSLIGQRITIYNPNIGTGGTSNIVTIVAGTTQSGGSVIRGVGLPTSSGQGELTPIPLNAYKTVKKIEFTNGLIELQCVPSSGNACDWCVVNVGTNICKLYENV